MVGTLYFPSRMSHFMLEHFFVAVEYLFLCSVMSHSIQQKVPTCILQRRMRMYRLSLLRNAYGYWMTGIRALNAYAIADNIFLLKKPLIPRHKVCFP